MTNKVKGDQEHNTIRWQDDDMGEKKEGLAMLHSSVRDAPEDL